MPAPFLRATACLVLAGVGACQSSPEVESHGRPESAAEAKGQPESLAGTADPTISQASELEGLRLYVGKYVYDGYDYLVEDPLGSRLQALLGARYPTFLAHMKVIGPLKSDAGILYTYGNKPHQGGVDMAAIAIDPGRDAIYVWLMEERKAEEFRERGVQVPVPEELKAFIANALAAE